MARKAKKQVGKKNALTLDFTGVETSSRVPDGDYMVKVTKLELKDKEDEGTQYLQFQLTITEGKQEGKTLRHINSLKPNALFALRNTLEALNFPIPSGAFDLDMEAVIGSEMAVSVENEEYNGKDQSRVVDVFTIEDFEADDEEEEGDEPEAADDADEGDDEGSDDADSDEDGDEDDEVEDYTEEELEAMDEEELLEAAEEYEVKPVYTGKGAKKKLSVKKTIAAIMEVIDEDEDEE